MITSHSTLRVKEPKHLHHPLACDKYRSDIHLPIYLLSETRPVPCSPPSFLNHATVDQQPRSLAPRSHRTDQPNAHLRPQQVHSPPQPALTSTLIGCRIRSTSPTTPMPMSMQPTKPYDLHRPSYISRLSPNCQRPKAASRISWASVDLRKPRN